MDQTAGLWSFFWFFFCFFFGFRTRFVRFAGAPLSFADIPRELSTASTEHGPITAAIAVVVVGIFGGRHWNWLWYSFGRRRRRRRPRSTTAKWMRKCASTRTGPTRARPDSLGDFISGQGGTSVSEVVCFCRLLMRFHGEDDHFKVFAAFRRRRLLCGRPPPYLTVPRCFFVFLPSFTVFALTGSRRSRRGWRAPPKIAVASGQFQRFFGSVSNRFSARAGTDWWTVFIFCRRLLQREQLPIGRRAARADRFDQWQQFR